MASLPFKCEYSKSGQASCRLCGGLMENKSLRIAFLEPNEWSSGGMVERWHHPDCFFRRRTIENISDLAGFDRLRWCHQEMIREFVKPHAGTKRKISSEEQYEIEQMKWQSERFWAIRDELDRNCKGLKDFKTLLEANNQKLPMKKNRISGTRDQYLDRLADCMLFGALERCENCNGGQFVFSTSKNAYICVDSVSGYTKCQNTTKEPKRTDFVIPESLAKHKFLGQWQFTPGQKRFFSGSRPAPTNVSRSNDSSFSENPDADVSDSYRQQVSNLSRSSSKRFRSDEYRSKKSLSGRSMPIHNGTAIDEEAAEYASFCHVYVDPEGNKYSAIMVQSDVNSGNNMYYKLQLFEANHFLKYYLFRSWGEVGCEARGGTKEDQYGFDQKGAVLQFERVFFEKTGNEWKYRANFVKKPNKFMPLELDYGDDNVPKSKVSPGLKTKLPKPVQDLLMLIFDVKRMQNALKEFEIDLEKMPLGKLSKKQIAKAYKVLQDLLTEMDSAGATETQIRDATNQFYTLIPHDFSIRKMKPLSNIKIIEEKVELLRSLEDLEVAYGVLKSESMDEDKDPIDIHYEALKTDFEVLPKDSADFKMLQEFVKNTHGETHKLYVLELEEVFKIRRHGEVEKFQKNLHNRMLLWHGSLLSNYVGILSQGLRIAPPEAPLTGSMFGKGLYFADMVTKSANYCHAESTNQRGLLLLSEVALGDMHDLKHSDSGLPIVSKLPEGKNSTRGLGKIIPDPKGKRVIEDGVIVPMGKGIKSQEQGLVLMYNEYVVYNVDQMKMRYLLKCKFVPVYDCT